jgi:hypothetical protein
MRRTAPSILLGLLLAACGPRLVQEPVHETEQVRVILRRTLIDGEPAPRGYEHPAVIADVRVAHILASLSYEDRKGRLSPIVRAEHVYELAEGLAKALGKAGPDDEIVAAAFSRDRRYVVFSDRRVTAFRTFLREGQLTLEFFALEEALERDAPREEGYTIPADPPGFRPSFRLIASQAQAIAGPRTLLVDWRDARYRNPVGLRTRSGALRRRTVLMRSEADEQTEPPAEPADLSDAQLRALDQLAAARRAGLIPEAEFQRRRRLILDGRVDEAGYGTEPP